MASETIELVDSLVKAKIPKKTATQLVDYIEKYQSESLQKDVNWLKWTIGVGFTLTFTIMIYLHNDLKSEIRDQKSEIRENRKLIKKIESKIDLLLNKK